VAEAKVILYVGVLIIMCGLRNLCGAAINISIKHNLHFFYFLMQSDNDLLTAETCICWFYIKI
jgi:hypothetical protein